MSESAEMEVLRQEVATRRVRVGVIEPGLVATDMTLGTGIGGELGTSADDWLRVQDLAETIASMVTRPKHWSHGGSSRHDGRTAMSPPVITGCR